MALCVTDALKYTLSGHNLRFFTLTPTLSQWERALKEIAAYNRSKYKTPERHIPLLSLARLAG
jgi:hypothetical protein